ncbi:MAG: DNA primase [Anaplasma sp.]
MSASHSGSDHVTLIREKVQLLDVVSKKVKLAKRGSGQYVGLCPFHSEKTPSFHVNCSNGLFYCFGCGVYGDVIQFVSNTEGLEFKEAMEYLAREYSVDLPKNSGSGEADSIYGLMDYVARWCVWQLSRSRTALSYLKSRGVSEETIRKFKVGYVPSSGLKSCLLSSEVSTEKVKSSGLLTKNGQDCLYNRIVFPICSASGRVIAFGGRSLKESHVPKYLNSAENILFKKRASLYGLHAALASAKKLGKIVVVEGYMDVLILSQMGIENVVGLLGTAMTETHLRNLWDMVPEIVVWMDGDGAGVSASVKIANLALSIIQSGHGIRFVTPPEDKDPCDICNSLGADAAKNLVEKAQLISEFIWGYELHRMGIAAGKVMPEQCMMLEGRIRDYTSKIRDVNISRYYKSFFYQQIRALQRGERSDGSRNWGGNMNAIAHDFRSNRLGGISVQACAEEHHQMRVIYTLIGCPELLYDATVFEQFAGLDFTGDMRLLQQHIVDIVEAHEGRLSKQDLVAKLCARDTKFEQILHSVQQKMLATGYAVAASSGGDSNEGEGTEGHVRKEWEKLMLSKQLSEIQDQIVKLRLEGRDEVALSLSDHAREVDDKLRSLWRC